MTVILNNVGWKAPKLSLLGVYPDGHGSKASRDQLTIGFGPEPPDYAQIAVAAGDAWGRRISKAEELQETIHEAINVVIKQRRCAVVDCVVE